MPLARVKSDRLLAVRLLPRLLGVELLHRIGGLAARGFLVELLGFRELGLAEQHDEAVGLLDAGDRRIGQELAGQSEMPHRLLLARAVGEAREHPADLADDLAW